MQWNRDEAERLLFLSLTGGQSSSFSCFSFVRFAPWRSIQAGMQISCWYSLRHKNGNSDEFLFFQKLLLASMDGLLFNGMYFLRPTTSRNKKNKNERMKSSEQIEFCISFCVEFVRSLSPSRHEIRSFDVGEEKCSNIFVKIIIEKSMDEKILHTFCINNEKMVGTWKFTHTISTCAFLGATHSSYRPRPYSTSSQHLWLRAVACKWWRPSTTEKYSILSFRKVVESEPARGMEEGKNKNYRC